MHRAKYGVSLEKGPFDKRTADYVWMFIFGAMSLLVLSAVPYMRPYFLGSSLVFMIVYVWSRELPDARINVYGLVHFKGFYLPYVMMAIDLLLGNSLRHKVVAYWGEGTQINAPVQSSPYAGVVFQGRSYRLNGNTRRATTPEQQPQTNTVPQPNQGEGVAFRGRSHRLDRS
ncbi:hypothetical protein ACLB2K_070181 [Fragaria x ananassa]